jgi:hypothetical protein
MMEWSSETLMRWKWGVLLKEYIDFIFNGGGMDGWWY